MLISMCVYDTGVVHNPKMPKVSIDTLLDSVDIGDSGSPSYKKPTKLSIFMYSW